jgi:MoaA/NifB/PqqE/SkfB family radical SAM enzyme
MIVGCYAAKKDDNIIKEIMNSLVNGIKGWYFEPEVIAEANCEGRMLTMDYELGRACPLKCIYCYRTEDSRDIDRELLDHKTWKSVIDQAAELGVQSIKLIGGGEITQDRDFLQSMEYIAKKGIITVLFTAGNLLGNNELCQKTHGISAQYLAKWMYDLGMSIFVKMDSLNSSLQDEIAGVNGYAVLRDRAFDLLMETGFNNDNLTRLGLEVNVSRRNYHEIMEIYALRVKYNVYEDVVVSMPCDVYFRNRDNDITLNEKRELYKNIYEYNRKHFIPFEEISPFIGGLLCTQLGNGLYVTNRGDVYHCPGSFERINNIKEKSLSTIWGKFSEKRIYNNSYFCPFRENAGIIPTSLVEEIRHSIICAKSNT